MPESFHSSNTRMMGTLLTRKLRRDAAILRKKYANGADTSELYALKDEMLAGVYAALIRCLGTPPEKFDFEYKDKEDNYHIQKDLTPKEFYKKYVDIDLSDYVSLINAPTADKPMNKTFTVQRLGNVVGGRSVKYLNVSIDEFKEYALSQLKDNEVVWFGCDVGKFLSRELGIMDLNLYDYDAVLGADISISKQDQLDYGDSLMTHAMVFTAVNIVDGKSVRWKVENSWGEKTGKDGWYIMSDEWFDKYMYQVVINKKHLSQEHLVALELEL